MLGATLPAAAQTVCTLDRATMIEALAEKHREAPVAMGIANTGHLIEVLVTDDGSTWTILATAPRGETCVMAYGEDWRVETIKGPGA